MLLTIETTRTPGGPPATDLGYLLHKNPVRAQTFGMSFGKAHVFYPEADNDRCRAAVLLDVDPVGLVRGKGRPGGSGWGGGGGTLDQYVNDRPYVASSFMSVAIAELFGTAMNGRSKERQELVDRPLPLRATVAVVPVGGPRGEELLTRLFAPLGYTVRLETHPLDEQFPDWAGDDGGGVGRCGTLTLEHTLPVRDLLRHLYVLIPVLDDEKHYFVGPEEVEKLLARGQDWLPSHPDRELIAHRYLKRRISLTRDALARLAAEAEAGVGADPDAAAAEQDAEEETVERPISLNRQRMTAVLEALKANGAASVLDLGCGEGTLLRDLLAEKQFTRIVGMDVSLRSLEKAAERLRLDRMPERQRARLTLLHGSLMYRDARLRPNGEPFDAAALVEVIEHLDPPRLRAMERAVFEFARPRTVVITTPNREYNSVWESLPAGKFRHRDHRFEWTRAEFRAWAERVASAHGYTARFAPVGPEDTERGSPTQMAVLEDTE